MTATNKIEVEKVASAVEAGKQRAEQAKQQFYAWRKNKIEGYKQSSYREVVDVAERWDVPRGKDVPVDLRDTKGNFWRAKGGFRVTGRVLPEDFAQGAKSPAEPIAVWLGLPITYLSLATVGCLPVLVYLFLVKQITKMGTGLFIFFALALIGSSPTLASMLHLTEIPFVGSIIASVLGASPKVLAWLGVILYTQKAWGDRTKRLARQGAQLTAESAGELTDLHLDARKMQVENAKKDSSPFIRMGTATGKIYKTMHDPFGASEGVPMGLTCKDYSTHLFVFGSTGTGKTSSMLRPIAVEYALSGYGGMIVFDGKGALPVELAEIPNFQLITPEDKTTPLALIEGLPAEDVVDAILNTSASEDKADFWKREGERLLRHCAVLLEHASQLNPQDAAWTLANIMRTVSDPAYREWLVNYTRKNHTDVDTGGILDDALHYFLDEFVHIPEQTRQSHVGTAMSYLSPVVGHRELQHWAKIDKGVDPTICLEGGLVGVCVPPFKYGTAGVVAQNLIKTRIYRAIRRRPADWGVSSKDEDYRNHKPVLMLIDEAQELCGSQEQETLPVARSLGLMCAYASQNIDSFYARLQEHGAEALLNNFRSLVSFQSSPKTMKYISERMGFIEHIKRKANPLGIDYMQEAKVLAESPVNDPHHPSRETMDNSVSSGVLGKIKALALPDAQHRVGVQFEVKHEPVFPPSFASIVLQEPFVAVAALNRAGVQRRDIIKANPVFSIPDYLANRQASN